MSEEYKILVSADIDSASALKIKKKLIAIQETINKQKFRGNEESVKAQKAELQLQLKKIALENQHIKLANTKATMAKKALKEEIQIREMYFKQEQARVSALNKLKNQQASSVNKSYTSSVATSGSSAKDSASVFKTKDIASGQIEKAARDAKILALELGKIGTPQQRAQIGRYNFELQRMKITSDMTEDEIRQMGAAATKTYKNMSYLRREMAATHKETKSLGTVMGNAITKFSMWMGVTAIFYGITGAMKSLITRSGELDKAVTSLRVVTGKTKEEAWETIAVYSDLADQMGTTTTAVAEGTLEWLRQGKTIEESMKLTTESIKLARLGFMDSAQATEYLTSSINGFNMEAEDASMIVDKLVAVDNNAATSTAELATALQRTANSADMAGVSFDEVVSYIGTVSEVTRKSAGGIGETFNVRGMVA